MSACGHMIAPVCGCDDALLIANRRAAAELKALRTSDGPSFLEHHGVVQEHVKDAAPPHVEDVKPAKRKAKNARHSKENPNWETDPESIACARAALGGHIDLDPFSCTRANARIKAAHWFGPDHADPVNRDGFSIPWTATTVFENHPGGTTKRAWQKTCDEWLAGHYRRLIWMCFSIEQICVLSEPNLPGEITEARWRRGVFVPTDFSICFLRKRVHFIDGDKPDRPDRPGHANAVIGIGTDTCDFEDAYAAEGQIIHGDLAGFDLARLCTRIHCTPGALRPAA